MSDWPHQIVGVRSVIRRLEAGVGRVILAAPTGAGKSRMMHRLIEHYGSATIYLNRKMLLEQLCRGLAEAGIEHGIQAAGYAPDIDAAVQVAMVQTVEQRWSKGEMHLHDGRLVILDECHSEKGERMASVIDAHVEAGQKFVGVTATPVGCGDMADHLVVAGTNSQLRECGALLRAVHYAPDEPDMKLLKSPTVGVQGIRDAYREKYRTVLFGRVVDHYQRLNPDGLPTILFASGVDESLWFAQEFCRAGFRAAHVDGERVWINGETFEATDQSRDALSAASEHRDVEIICNRFVLREGIDMPWLAHGILACTFGSVTSYIQAGGRLLRNHPSLETVTCQDHGGNWWRWGSLNDDREWNLDDTPAKLKHRHEQAYRTKAKAEPTTCPKCSAVKRGVKCAACGHMFEGRKRMVVQTNGKLKEVTRECYPERKVCKAPGAHEDWIRCYHRCKKTGKTFNQARGLFQKEHFWQVPDESFPLYPIQDSDWFEKVRDVPVEDLTPVQTQQREPQYA